MYTLDYIEYIAPMIQKHMGDYGICCASAVIAQAINESGWGQSSLAKKYHNHFGMKCGSGWTGKSVNLNTKEEYTAGTLTNISANFRVYDSDEEGVVGYFEFLQYSRYSNLKGVTDYKEYINLIKQDGWATSSSYVSNLIKIVEEYGLTAYDSTSTITSSESDESTLYSKYSYDVAEIALEVYQGKWGNGATRKERLIAAGYDYDVVQAYVNKVYYGIG